ncbi:alpha-13-mannosyltransferase CMT1 protein [Rutstroemia sp. NJR-2017a BBW]|nr:alpha-13-mannosyltransferase CMT1 protein [Rutstroemia sp. NJR-2017a BBW]
MRPEESESKRIACPALLDGRYDHLRNGDAKPKYFFTLNLRQCIEVLPQLLGAVIEAIRFLGPQNCVLSIVEGNSDDGTFEVLRLLKPALHGTGIRYFFESSDIDSHSTDRIAALSQLRNLALKPLTESQDEYSPNTTIVFLNDISICLEDILEIIHQKVYQKADMTCAMDWAHVMSEPTFYDVWISRGITGDSFFDIPADGSWDLAPNLFWNDPITRDLYQAHKPFQVFSCWNGIAAIIGEPFMTGSIAFRAPKEEECFQGEPSLLAKDMWNLGHGKIAVIPSVNVEYSNERTTKIKGEKGFTSEWVEKERDTESTRIVWQEEPPAKVRCMRSWTAQTWEVWNEGLI